MVVNRKIVLIVCVRRYHRLDIIGVSGGKIMGAVLGWKLTGGDGAIYSDCMDKEGGIVMGGSDWVKRVKIIE